MQEIPDEIGPSDGEPGTHSGAKVDDLVPGSCWSRAEVRRNTAVSYALQYAHAANSPESILTVDEFYEVSAVIERFLRTGRMPKIAKPLTVYAGGKPTVLRGDFGKPDPAA